LTNTTKPKPIENGLIIGELPNKRIQYMNNNYIGIFDKQTFNFLKEKQSTTLKDLEGLGIIEKTIKSNIKNINHIEFNLSNFFQNNQIKFVNKHEDCLNTKIIDNKCLEYFKIKYGDGYIIIIEQIINNI
jgi:hypothetical protein